jgi:large subunit ribosomal protein L13
MLTHSPSITSVERKWHLIDAEGKVLGRLSTQIAKLLMGKQKTDFVRHLDIGDHVVITNAKKIVVTGNKATQKIYHRHSGWPGGMRVTTFAQMQAKKPEDVIIKAVSGMLPKNRLHDKILRHLHVFPGTEHDYLKQFKNG